jgi:uncharacterized protein (TIRG00374 family)
MSEEITTTQFKQKNKRRDLLRLLIGVSISVLTLWLAFRSISISELADVLREVSLFWVFMAVVSILINHFGKAIRWKILMGKEGKKIRFLPFLASLMIGQMVNLIVPIRLGEFTRAYQIGSLGPGTVYVLGSVLIEKVLDMLGYALMFFLLLLAYPTPEWINHSATGFIITALVITGLLFSFTFMKERVEKILLRLIKKFPEKFQLKVTPWIITFLNSLVPLKSPTILLWVSFWNIVIWGTGLLTNQFVAYSLNLDLPWIAPVLILIVLQAGISIPSVPGRIGVIELLSIMALGLFGVDKTTALAFGIILHLVILLPITIMGAVLMAIPGVWQKVPENSPNNWR